MMTDEIVALLRTACAKAGSQRDWAGRYRISESYVCDVLKGRRRPGPMICAALGFKPVVSYEPQKKKGRANGKG
jgi:hypothetical protein